MSSRGGWLVIVFLLALHFSLHPLWVRWPINLDLLAAALLLGSLLLRPDRAAILGAVLGILEASISLGALGSTMLVFAAAGFVGAWLSDLLYSDAPQFVPTFLFGGIWILQTVLTLLTDVDVLAQSLFLYVPMSALLTALVFWVLEHVVGVRGLTVFSGKARIDGR